MEYVNLDIKVEPIDETDNNEDERHNENHSKSEDSNENLLCTPDIDHSSNENSTDVSDTPSRLIDMRSKLLGFGLAASKRKHKVLSLETKIELIRRLEQGESGNSLAKLYNIGRATIFDIKNKKDSILSFASKLKNDDELKTRKTVRKKIKTRSEKTTKNDVKPSSSSVDSLPNAADASLDLFAPKRKHHVLTIETKLELIQRLERGESSASLATLYNIGRSTISDIRSKKDSILMFASKLKSDEGLKKRKTMRKPSDISLENAVYTWYIQKLSQGETVTGPLLCEKALELNSKLGGPPDFKASSGWLKNFRARHGIKHIQNEKESVSVDISEAKSFLESYYDLLLQEEYSRDDIYTADETEVDWQSMPERSFVCHRNIVDNIRASDRVTIMLCANISYTHSLPLVMIGRSKKSKYFGEVSCLPVIYRHQKHAWMDSEIFIEWYANEFIPSVKKERELKGRYGPVVLLLDSAPYHPLPDMLNVIDENFKVMFLPPNVTAFAHPMNQSIIKKLKWSLKKQILRRLLLAAHVKESVVKHARNLTLKECCYMMADTWNTLCEEKMKDEWNKVWGVSGDPDAEDHNEEKDLKEFVELFKAVAGFSKCSLENAREWLKMDAGDPGDLILDEDEIVTSARCETPEDAEKVEEGDQQQNSVCPTPSEAFKAFERAMEWCERQIECSPEQLIGLKRLKDLAAKKIWFPSEDSKPAK